jgi:hypothetical protein
MSKKYKLLTTAIVSALHPNQPQAGGSVWEPKDRNEVLEAEALHQAGLAEPTNESATVRTLTDAAEAAAEDVSDEDVLSGSIDEVVASLDQYDDAGLKRLAKLEKKGKDRKGIADAIAAKLAGE